MPFIRLYSKASSLREKRRIASQLISIAQRTLDLPQDEIHSVSVQFLPAQISRPEYSAVVEVSGQNIEPKKMVRFVGEVAPALSDQLRAGPLQRLFGIQDSPKMVAVEFNGFGAERNVAGHDHRLFEVSRAA